MLKEVSKIRMGTIARMPLRNYKPLKGVEVEFGFTGSSCFSLHNYSTHSQFCFSPRKPSVVLTPKRNASVLPKIRAHNSLGTDEHSTLFIIILRSVLSAANTWRCDVTGYFPDSNFYKVEAILRFQAFSFIAIGVLNCVCGVTI